MTGLKCVNTEHPAVPLPWRTVTVLFSSVAIIEEMVILFYMLDLQDT